MDGPFDNRNTSLYNTVQLKSDTTCRLQRLTWSGISSLMVSVKLFRHTALYSAELSLDCSKKHMEKLHTGAVETWKCHKEMLQLKFEPGTFLMSGGSAHQSEHKVQEALSDDFGTNKKRKQQAS